MPQNDLSYTENFLYMMDRLSEENYRPNPVLAKALDVLFILHADHELNCSTAAMRHISSSKVDPYKFVSFVFLLSFISSKTIEMVISAIAGAAAALYGPLHGGACEVTLSLIFSITTTTATTTTTTRPFSECWRKLEAFRMFPASWKELRRERERKLMGFGHRIYKNYDPRARIIKKTAYEVFQVVGKEPLIEIAIALEEAALADPYFIERKLYPNVDFYSGLIYKGFSFFSFLFSFFYPLTPIGFTFPNLSIQTKIV